MKKTIFVMTVMIISSMLLQTASAATAITSCTKITSPGEYYLSGDITTNCVQKCIEINADNVTLNCEGHMIRYNGFFSTTTGIFSEKDDVTITNCVIRGWSSGITLGGTENANISYNDILYCKMSGIRLVECTYPNIHDNEIHGSTIAHGLDLWKTYWGNIYDNEMHSNEGSGIYLSRSNQNNVKNNTIHNNENGISVQTDSDKNEIRNNNISFNALNGIHISCDSISNRIFNNYVANNTYSASDRSYGKNSWNTTNQTGPNIIGGPYIGGNYFSDYTGNDTNGDGFGETPYKIKWGCNSDYLPLVIPEFPVMFLSVGLIFLSLFVRRKNGLL
ncbi:MAG: right-handed parallel beta-helix repeat-containing protein [Candidatus Aenigmarchaeota archaeon]|nr:right-handed parallel beta-helix repeat-containing protein [Candidatus Aenigmarchaeota archaeon]